jgi:hypothetical protein
MHGPMNIKERSVIFSENVFRLVTVCLQVSVLHYVNKHPF